MKRSEAIALAALMAERAQAAADDAEQEMNDLNTTGLRRAQCAAMHRIHTAEADQRRDDIEALQVYEYCGDNYQLDDEDDDVPACQTGHTDSPGRNFVDNDHQRRVYCGDPIERITKTWNNQVGALVAVYQSRELPDTALVAFRAGCLGCHNGLAAGGADLDAPAEWVTAEQAEAWATAHAAQCAQFDPAFATSAGENCSPRSNQSTDHQPAAPPQKERSHGENPATPGVA